MMMFVPVKYNWQQRLPVLQTSEIQTQNAFTIATVSKYKILLLDHAPPLLYNIQCIDVHERAWTFQCCLHKPAIGQNSSALVHP